MTLFVWQRLPNQIKTIGMFKRTEINLSVSIISNRELLYFSFIGMSNHVDLLVVASIFRAQSQIKFTSIYRKWKITQHYLELLITWFFYVLFYLSFSFFCVSLSLFHLKFIPRFSSICFIVAVDQDFEALSWACWFHYVWHINGIS